MKGGARSAEREECLTPQEWKHRQQRQEDAYVGARSKRDRINKRTRKAVEAGRDE